MPVSLQDTAGDHEAALPCFAAALLQRSALALPHEDSNRAKLCLIDFLACALASVALPWCRQAIAIASPQTGEAGAGIVGTSSRTTPADAAFANAVLGHGLVRDDMHLTSVSHLSVVVMPAALALSETAHASGRDFLSAIVCGYEAGARLGRMLLDVEVAKTHRPTGLVGAVAAAATAGMLMGLSREQMSTALSLAVNTCAGSNEWAATGGSEMFFHPGFAVRNGLSCARLAESGAYASSTALEGPAGLMASMGRPAPGHILLPFEEAAEIHNVFFKEVPACNFAQTPAQAARSLAGQLRGAEARIARIKACVTYAAACYPGCDATGPFEHILQAKMSIQYNVAAALLTGDFSEANFDPRQRADIAALARRVSVEVDESFTQAYPSRQGARVHVLLTDGRELEAALDDVLAASPSLVKERFDEAATERLGATRAGELAAYIDALDKSDSVSELVSKTQAA